MGIDRRKAEDRLVEDARLRDKVREEIAKQRADEIGGFPRHEVEGHAEDVARENPDIPADEIEAVIIQGFEQMGGE